jgi:hypothetical protein
MGRILLMYLSFFGLKNLAQSIYQTLKYKEVEDKYNIFIVLEGIIFECEIWKNTSVCEGIDIEQNNVELVEWEEHDKNNSINVS